MWESEQLRIDVRCDSGRATLVLVGELDLASAETLQQALTAEQLEHQQAIVLDLQQLQFLDSTGLRGILTAFDRCRERHQEFAITPAPQQVQRLLEVTGAIDLLPLATPAGDPSA